MASEWTKRGWRRRSDLEPGQRLMKAELAIEALETERDELRRLAIRLARGYFETGGINHERCNNCREHGEVNASDSLYAMKHTPGCPIAKLEAEEAATTTAGNFEGES